MSKLEEKIKREKAASKGWKVQNRKLEADILNLGSHPSDKKGSKKLLDEKDKLIKSLQKKLKGQVSDHPHTEEIMSFQTKNDELKKEVMELKEKLLQITKEKDDLTKDKDVLLKEKEQFAQRPLPETTTLIAPIVPQWVDAEELSRSLAQVS